MKVEYAILQLSVALSASAAPTKREVGGVSAHAHLTVGTARL